MIVSIERSIDGVMDPAGKLSPGVSYGIDDRVYRADCRMNPSSLAPGLLSNGEIDPAAIRLAFEGGDRDRTPAAQDRMNRGTLAHLAILQPELIASRVAVWTGGRRASAEWDAFNAENEGKLIIKREDYAETISATDRIIEVPRIRGLLAGIKPEVSIYAEEGTGPNTIYCMGRVDAIKTNPDGITHIFDLKTTEAGIDWYSVQRTIREFRYREKMALYRRWYCSATNSDPELVQCHLIFVRLKAPVAIQIVRMSTLSMEFGEYMMGRALDSVRHCIRSGVWPVFVGEQIADVADWELPKEEMEIED